MIEFRDVHKRFGPKVVLDGVSFRAEPAEIVFILGRSGMGKSVLLKQIVGLLRPDRGEIIVGKTEVGQLPEAQFHEIRRMCGMVFQFPALLDSLDVFENVAFGLRAHRLFKNEDDLRQKVLLSLKRVGLGEDILKTLPPRLSFGAQKRVSIARTIAVDPRCLLFDEPTTGLDPVTTWTIARLIQDLSRRLEVTSLVVSHDMDVALEIADRILLLDSGKLVAQGKPRELLESDNELARAFLREAKARARA